jgi:hypothetical protein
MRKKLTYDEFVNRANIVFNNIYDYSKFVYINNYTKGIIICSLHGQFLQKPNNHLHGQRCSQCTNNKKLDTFGFIEKAKYIHQNKYDYSQSNYINSATKIKIVCPIHGVFEQKPNNHLSSAQGCPKCKEAKGERLIRSWLVKNKIKFDSHFTVFGYKNEKSLLFDFAIFDDQKLVGLIEYNGESHSKIILNETKTYHKDQIKIDYCKTHNIPLLIVSYEEVTQLNTFLKEFVAKQA